MEVKDGFIVGVWNYCDRWCERCALTSWCRLFADAAEEDAASDPHLEPIVHAPLLASDVEPVPKWLQELIDEPPAADDEPPPVHRQRNERDPVVERAFSYSLNVHQWRRTPRPAAASDAESVISWFGTLLPAKIGRAFSRRCPAEHWLAGEPSDQDGSAKVALIGIEQSHAAWLQLVESGYATLAEVDPFVADLVWMGEAIERAFPKARAFVRPGFDEPDAVARLVASPDSA